MDTTEKEEIERARILGALTNAIHADETIRVPFANDPSPFSGTVGSYVYSFEGEDDLLHISVTRRDGAKLTAEEGQAVVSWLLPGMPPGLIWIRPGELSQHFYCGHDDLVANVEITD